MSAMFFLHPSPRNQYNYINARMVTDVLLPELNVFHGFDRTHRRSTGEKETYETSLQWSVCLGPCSTLNLLGLKSLQ